jgi:hypothetical protein
MVLQEKLRSIKMLKSKSVTSYLKRFTQTRDELAEIGEIVDPMVLVRTALNEFSKPWETFVRGIMAREAMLSWERLWDDFVQEELRFISRSSGQQHVVEGEEDLALYTKGKKKTSQGAREGPKRGAKPQETGSGQKRDLSKVKCFACKRMGHYVGQCPNRQKKRSGGTTSTTDEEEFTAQFERECAFLICCASVETTCSIWYIDSGASSHITGVRAHFTDLRDPEIKMEIELGYDTTVRVVGRGTVAFQRDTMPPISFRDLLFVHGLKKNLISVSTLQDRGLEVSFKGTEVLIHPKGSNITFWKVIGVRDGKLYRLYFQPLHALATSSNNQSYQNRTGH